MKIKKFTPAFQGKSSGFTLIELLLVIAIIAILASILFPVFGRARENARRSSCQSNLKQIGLGIMQYTQDYDEHMPSCQMAVSGITGSGNWQVLLQPYIKSYQLFQCPSNIMNNTPMLNGADSGTPVKTMVSYGASREAGGSGPGGGFPGSNGASFGPANVVGPPLADFASPSTTISVTDCNTSDTDYRMSADLWNNANAQNSGNNPVLFVGHLSTMNCLFADGHVKSMKPLQTVSTTMGGSGSVNMWSRYNTDGAFVTSIMNKIVAATNFYK
jgi:prepilin-type N-terminal cleavage/methylation domain-containing protein/prepilin-type processing-associated H-X9-DG protein